MASASNGTRKRKRMGSIDVAAPKPRKRARRRVFSKIRQLGRSIVQRSYDTLRGRDLTTGGRSYPYCHTPVKIGGTVDIFPLLGDDFLISNLNHNNQEVRVRVDDIRGKTVLVYMTPLRLYPIPGGLSDHSMRFLIATLKERDFDFEFEVLLVPVNRGPHFFHNCAMNRFNDIFAKTPCVAVPFANKLACDLIQDTFRRVDFNPFWALIDPSGKVLLTSDFVFSPDFIFNDYGIGELVPLMHKMLPSLVDAQNAKLVLYYSLIHYDKAAVEGIINLNKLLPDFLLTNDGNKVPVSILKDKVVGLYFYNHFSSEHSRIQPIKKMYEDIGELGYDFEIVQINYHYFGYFQGNLNGYKSVPWLTLPYSHSRFKRLFRIFHNDHIYFPDRLVIINPHESVRKNRFFDRHGADTMHHFGIEAYPFTMRRVLALESARRREEINLRLIFGHRPLLRRRGGSYDQVPVSQLWGKRVLLIFTVTHSKCKSMINLKSKYLEQNGVNVFEVVYISYDTNASTFDDYTVDMPWLVHPYSREFARTWVRKIFTKCKFNGTYNSLSGTGTWCGMVNFENGEFISKNDTKYDLFYENSDSESSGESILKKEYPFFRPHTLDDVIIRDIMGKYGLGGFLI